MPFPFEFSGAQLAADVHGTGQNPGITQEDEERLDFEDGDNDSPIDENDGRPDSPYGAAWLGKPAGHPHAG